MYISLHVSKSVESAVFRCNIHLLTLKRRKDGYALIMSKKIIFIYTKKHLQKKSFKSQEEQCISDATWISCTMERPEIDFALTLKMKTIPCTQLQINTELFEFMALLQSFSFTSTSKSVFFFFFFYFANFVFSIVLCDRGEEHSERKWLLMKMVN